jgi:lipopolysaccharide biosynthesis regulator YciM
LNPDDVWADREWQRLTYLIAVGYEIAGQTDKAVEMFVSVLQSKNQTLWGNLAALHLMAK